MNDEVRSYLLPDNRRATLADGVPGDGPPWSCGCRTRKVVHADGTVTLIGTHRPGCPEALEGGAPDGAG